jgi:MarR family 2-MHQ and catechol resistance regulon transcriptional repressor
MNHTAMTDTEREVLKLYATLMRASSSVTDRMHRHLSDHKLTLSQFGVLEALYHLGPLSQKTIGEKILKTSGNITMVIDNLEKRDLVKRERRTCDRRCFNVGLTPAGLRMIERILPVHGETASRVFSVLSSDEQHTLGALLKKIGKATDNDMTIKETNKQYNEG